MEDLKGIPGAAAWTKVEPVLKGWSADLKYSVEDATGRRLLLRVAEGKDYSGKLAEFQMIQRVNALNFPMSQALEIGTWGKGEEQQTYMLLSWVDGQPLEECLSSFSEEKQYELGLEAGRILKQIHSLPVTEPQPDWEPNMQRKILQRIESYEEICPFRVKGDGAVLAFIRENIGVVADVQQVLQHGDFHIGNHIYTRAGGIGVIDFNRWDIGDYAEEFLKVQFFDRERSVTFARGKLDGYFGGQPPKAFWVRHALYVAYVSLFSIQWAIPFGSADVEGMQERLRMTLADYDGFERLIPRWYDGEQSEKA